MKMKRFLCSALSLASVLAAVSAPARADDIDEKQAKLQSKINEAKSKKLLSSKDAHTLNDEMSDFSKKKQNLRTASGGALTLKDDEELDKSLSAINQDFETKKKSEPAKK